MIKHFYKFNFLFSLILLIILFNYLKKFIIRKVGIIGLDNHNNIGNNLVKFAIHTKIKEYGFEPIIIGKSIKNTNINFLKSHVKLREIKNNFSELKEDDYDILMVNSDQTWYYGGKYYLDIGFLNFAENWNKIKFIYGASFGINYWPFSNETNRIAKKLLKNFTGISVRENYAINLVEKNFGFKAEFVLDPTLLINKKYYLDLIINYKGHININEKYICVFLLLKNEKIENFFNESIKSLNYKNYYININLDNYIEDFLFAIYNCQAVMTDSFHGTVFSIIFNKPFISIHNIADGRLSSLGETLDLNERIYYEYEISKINISLLTKPLNYNITKFNLLKISSLNYLKRNLFYNKYL